jgi:hypothetical protein
LKPTASAALTAHSIWLPHAACLLSDSPSRVCNNIHPYSSHQPALAVAYSTALDSLARLQHHPNQDRDHPGRKGWLGLFLLVETVLFSSPRLATAPANIMPVIKANMLGNRTASITNLTIFTCLRPLVLEQNFASYSE